MERLGGGGVGACVWAGSLCGSAWTGENAGQFPETAPGEEGENIPADGEVPFDALPSDPPDGEAQPGGVTANAAESLSPGDMPGEAPAGEELPAGPFPGDAPLGDMPPGGDFPAGEESPFSDAGDAALFLQPQEGEEAESDDPEYGALLHELGETGYQESDPAAPLTLGPPPGDELPSAGIATRKPL